LKKLEGRGPVLENKMSVAAKESQSSPPPLEAVASSDDSDLRVALQRLELQKLVMERELQAQRTANMETVKLYSARETLLRFELEQLRATNLRLVQKLNGTSLSPNAMSLVQRSPSPLAGLDTDSDSPASSPGMQSPMLLDQSSQDKGTVKSEPAPTGIMPRRPHGRNSTKRLRSSPDSSPSCGSLTPPFQLPAQDSAPWEGNMLKIEAACTPVMATVPRKKRRPYRRKDGKNTKRFEALTALKKLGGRGTVQDVAQALKYDCRTTADSLKGLRDKGLIIKVAEKLSSGSSLGGRPANIWQVVQGA